MSEPERWSRSEGVLWRAVLDDAVVLVPGQPEPLALSGGASLWALLEVPRTTGDLARALGDQTGARSGDVEAGLQPLLARLAELGAVERSAS